VRVLIVDDSKVMRMIIIRALRQSGMGTVDVGEAEDGFEGLAMVETFKPDLILSDWNMPKMSGLDFLKGLRSTANTTAFGFITSETHPATKEQAFAAGASFLLTKPFSAEQFADLIGAAAS
jgi:two-component system chemotaxis response regulator CheY